MFKIRTVTKSFPLGPALKNLSLDIHEGEVLGLVGASGSGKTTLGKCLLALLSLDEGSIEFNGKDLSTFSRRELFAFRKQVQMVFQSPKSSLNPRMTVRQLIQEPLSIHSLKQKGEVLRLLRLIGLPDSILHYSPHELSGGMRQRVAIARALACKPRFIIFDEAISSLDASVQSEILRLLIELKESENLTYLFISHDLAAVQSISTRVAVMKSGSIVEVAPTETLFWQPKHPYTKKLLRALDPTEEIDPSYFTPSMLESASGCSCVEFCPKAEALCKVAAPPMAPCGENHFTLCHFP